MSQAEKDAVPEEVKRAAREMGEKAFKERYPRFFLTLKTCYCHTAFKPQHKVKLLAHYEICSTVKKVGVSTQHVCYLQVMVMAVVLMKVELSIY